MNTDTARDDLAYLRALVTPDQKWQHGFGQGYAAAGLCYGVQFILHGFEALQWLPDRTPVHLAVGIGPTVVFLILLALIQRRSAAEGSGVTARAVGSVFSAVGIANIVSAAVVGVVAWRQQSLAVWLIFPCVVMVFQGAAWLVAYALRRRTWLAVVAFGWFASGVAAAICIAATAIAAYLVISGLAFLALMLVPGLFMARQTARA